MGRQCRPSGPAQRATFALTGLASSAGVPDSFSDPTADHENSSERTTLASCTERGGQSFAVLEVEDFREPNDRCVTVERDY